MTPLEYHQKLMALDAMYPLSVTGGKRTQKRNARVKGNPNSRHRLWLADDVVLDDMSHTNKTAFTKEARRQGLVAVDERDHLHVQAP